MVAQSSSKNIVRLTIMMFVAIIVYSIVRIRLQAPINACQNIQNVQQLQGQAYVLKNKVDACKASVLPPDIDRNLQQSKLTLQDCERSAKKNNQVLEQLQTIQKKKLCKQCNDKFKKCQQNIKSFIGLAGDDL